MLKGLGEKSFILPGSPATLLIGSPSGFYVVDPGYPEERRTQIEGQGRIESVLLTHSHSDHILAAKGLRSTLGTYAPLHETPFLESAELREATTFGGYAPWDLIFHVEAASVHVDNPFRLPFKLDYLEAIALPGHTFSQVGYLTERGILYAADSFFGDKLLKRVVIPYFLDFETALRTLEWLQNQARDFEKIVPSHGPIVEGKRASELIEVNIKALESIREKAISVLRAKELTVEELTFRILAEGGAELTPSSLILGAVTLRSLLSRLYERGLAEANISERGIVWRVKD
ncbi:MAG: MBL fold metallo-hydrolase [Candidatus Korarchaeum sp.]|nr:MBL fold metallo-hydrolase [Candidatus Korarchaeum sp.]MDW8034971.1 MBL fold metallo-hydrolase [Candidatus Korarchaeum sp.]